MFTHYELHQLRAAELIREAAAARLAREARRTRRPRRRPRFALAA